MKHLFISLAIVLGLSAPWQVRADPASPEKRPVNAKSRRQAVIVDVPAGQRPVYRVTGTLLTGSHIPVVIRQFAEHHRPVDSGFRRNDKPGGSLPGLPGNSDAGTSQRRSEFGFF